MTNSGKLKCDNFLKNTNKYFGKTLVKNFDIIHNQNKWKKIDKKLVKEYKTIDNSGISYYSDEEKGKAVSSGLGTVDSH